MFQKPLHFTAHLCSDGFSSYTTSLYDSVQISLISGHDGWEILLKFSLRNTGKKKYRS